MYWLIENWLRLVIAGICLVMSFVIGQLTYQPKEIEVEVPVISYITVTEYEPIYETIEVDKPVYITVTKQVPTEVIVYRNIYPRQFVSVAAFKEWYNGLDFRFILPNGGDVDTADCDDYSARLQQLALEQSYSVSQALTWNELYYGIRVTDNKDGHAGNLVLIGTTYYWVEPQPDIFEVIKVCNRD